MINFIICNVLLGIGLAMDAFGVSVANAMFNPKMKAPRALAIAVCFGFFQFFMPMTGWTCVRIVVDYFAAVHSFVPWIAGFALIFIGAKMIIDSFSEIGTEGSLFGEGILILLIQGIATSIDALSVGFTIADYNFLMALSASLIISVVTFLICLGGIFLVKKSLSLLSFRAEILGGIILVSMGILNLVKIFL